MCIIVVKPCGVAMPDRKILETCFNNNPDGAGFMIKRYEEKTLTIDKGYFDFNIFWNSLQAYKISELDIVAMHFRIATSGRIDAATCHPFPISTDITHLRTPQIICNSAVVHNGILGPGTRDTSDTMLFVQTIAPTYHAGKEIDPIPLGNKLCLLDAARDKLVLYGGDWIDENGIKYSNNSYKPYVWDYNLKSGTGIDMDEFPIPGLCPVCETLSGRLISKYHGLYECDVCYTVFDDYGDTIL